MTFELQHNHTSQWNMDDWWSIYTWSVAECDGCRDTSCGSVVGCNVAPSSPSYHPYWMGSKSGGSDWVADFHSITWCWARCTCWTKVSCVGGNDFNFGTEWTLSWPFWTSTTDNVECSYHLQPWNQNRQQWRQLPQISDCLHLLPADRVRLGDVRPLVPSKLWPFQCQTHTTQYHNPSGHVQQANIWRCFMFCFSAIWRMSMVVLPAHERSMLTFTVIFSLR